MDKIRGPVFPSQVFGWLPEIAGGLAGGLSTFAVFSTLPSSTNKFPCQGSKSLDIYCRSKEGLILFRHDAGKRLQILALPCIFHINTSPLSGRKVELATTPLGLVLKGKAHVGGSSHLEADRKVTKKDTTAIRFVPGDRLLGVLES